MIWSEIIGVTFDHAPSPLHSRLPSLVVKKKKRLIVAGYIWRSWRHTPTKNADVTLLPDRVLRKLRPSKTKT